jgi:hypothetical protein
MNCILRYCKSEVIMELNCSKKQTKAYIEDILLMYENGIYDLSALTIMLLECPDLNVTDFLRSNIHQEITSQEGEMIIGHTSLIDYVRHKLVELYSDNPKLSANLTVPVAHAEEGANVRK